MGERTSLQPGHQEQSSKLLIGLLAISSFDEGGIRWLFIDALAVLLGMWFQMSCPKIQGRHLGWTTNVRAARMSHKDHTHAKSIVWSSCSHIPLFDRKLTIFVNRQIHQVHAPESKGLQVSRKVTLPFSFAQEEQSYEAEPHMDANKEKPALCVVFCVLHVVFCVVCVVGVVCCAYMDVWYIYVYIYIYAYKYIQIDRLCTYVYMCVRHSPWWI